MRIIYLHGFASGPSSKKARLFAEALPGLAVPDLSEGNFARLTISGQLKVIEGCAGADEVVLIGSSMGGYLAALYASRNPQVRRVVLLAPAFHFAQRWAAILGPAKLAEWERSRVLPVFHYALGREEGVGWDLMEDARRYDPVPSVTQPCVIYHGTNDEVVPVEYSRAYAARHSHVLFHEMDSGHELTNVAPQIVAETVASLRAT